MTPQQLNDWLATEIMEWHYMETSDAWFDENSELKCLYEDCKFTEDLNQAVMCADKFCEGKDLYWEFANDSLFPGYSGRIKRLRDMGKGVWKYSEATQPARALCKVIKEASEAVIW